MPVGRMSFVVFLDGRRALPQFVQVGMSWSMGCMVLLFWVASVPMRSVAVPPYVMVSASRLCLMVGGSSEYVSWLRSSASMTARSM